MLPRKFVLPCLLALVQFNLMPAYAADTPGWRAKVSAYAAAHFKHAAWGFSHSQRDYALARQRAAADHVTLDDDVLFAAAHLHDMGTFAPWAENKTDHSDVAAAKADTILAGTGFPMNKMDAVRDAIRTHMYYRMPGSSPEARYLHDADALDWLGAIGVARDMAMIDTNGGKPTGLDAVKDIEEDGATVPSRIVTPAGKARIAPRLVEQKIFLDALRRETDGLSTF
jgi:uncharacterized protein